MLDLLIKNAKICDGTGASSYVGYVGAADGKIVELGRGVAPGSRASRTIDADGLVLTPGFIDAHTHYDAQIAWDPLLTSSPWHGVTTIVQGNCGVGVAPLTPQSREYVLSDLEHVEEIPYELMDAAIPEGRWHTFGEFLDVIQQRGVAINVASLVPLSPMRRMVMGDACVERAANDDERKRLENLFRQSLNAGGFGWSATFAEAHLGHGGRPPACRLADMREVEMLSRVMAEADVGTAQVTFGLVKNGDLIDSGLEMLGVMTKASPRPVTYLILSNDPENPKAYLQSVRKLGGMLESGQVIPQFQVKPLTIIFNLRNTYVLCSYNKHLRKLLAKPDDYLTAHYSDPAFRTLVKTEFAENSLAKGFFDRVRVLDGGSDEVKELMKTGKPISQIARERGVDPTDCMLDIILNDHLDTAFAFAAAAYEPEGVKNLITDGRFLPGVADSGAHIQALNDSGAVTHLLGHWCRDKQVVSLEEGVRQITSFPADVFGIKHRGRIAKGNYADFALIDYDKVGSCMAEYVNDLPGGRRRMISRATGVEATIVNGQVLFDAGKHSGALPGKMLRSKAQ